jgi:hypothetical protein
MPQTAPFIILSLPRSRSAWLAAFLSYPPKQCGHDIASESRSVPDFLNRLARFDGTCETGAVVGWQLIHWYIPQARIIVVKRPVEEIKRSLAQFGIVPVEGELEARGAMLDACAALPSVTAFDFDELNDQDVCTWIFETCLGLDFDRRWYRKLANQNIQIDVGAQMAKLRGRQSDLTKLKSDVATAVRELEGVSGA